MSGVYQGIVPTLWRDVPSNALYFLAYEGVKRAMASKDGQLRTSQVRCCLFVLRCVLMATPLLFDRALSVSFLALFILTCLHVCCLCMQVLLAGSAAGVGYWLSIYPIDMVKTIMQTDHSDPAQRKYTGMLDATVKACLLLCERRVLFRFESCWCCRFEQFCVYRSVC